MSGWILEITNATHQKLIIQLIFSLPKILPENPVVSSSKIHPDMISTATPWLELCPDYCSGGLLTALPLSMSAPFQSIFNSAQVIP